MPGENATLTGALGSEAANGRSHCAVDRRRFTAARSPHSKSDLASQEASASREAIRTLIEAVVVHAGDSRGGKV
jgi:hypothetical protein